MTHPRRAFVRRDLFVIGLILVLAAAHGLLYVFILPPWQHYDEPNHFEYVWLGANLDRLPNEEDYSAKLSRQVVKSMLENGFFNNLPNKPVIGPPDQKIKLPGYSQLTEPPLYYLFASLPLRLIPNRGVDAQLYATRLASLFFFLITVLAGWGVGCELAPEGHLLRWMIPLALALTPAFVDLMTAVNNDVAAVALTSVIFYIGVRLIRRGFNLIDFLLLCVVGVLAYFTKQTVLVFSIGVLLILLFAVFRGGWRKVAWAIIGLGLLFGLAFSLRLDDAFAWFRNTSQLGSIRIRSDQAPWGGHAFAVQSGVEVTPHYFPALYQNMSMAEAKKLAGKQVTFGYWIWSDCEQSIRAPADLRVPNQSFSETLQVTRTPTFHAIRAILPQGVDRLWVDLNPLAEQKGSFSYYDGLVLAEGSYPTDASPVFSDPEAHSGEWGGKPFVNLLRNPSAETPGPRLNPLIDNPMAHFLPDNFRPSLFLATLVDSQGVQDLYPITAWHLFRTFWARFAWGNVALFGGEPVYRFLFYLSLLCVTAALIGGLRRFSQTPWDVVVTLGLVTLLSIIMAQTRGAVYLPTYGFYYATARYFYPAIIPLMLLFAVGWLELSVWAAFLWRRLPLKRDAVQTASGQPLENHLAITSLGLFFIFFITLDVVSIIGIVQYYY